jgi:glycosyltransferase involved in cell wall biosynthesis
MRIAVLGSRGFPSTYSGYETFIRHFVPRAIAAGHEVVVYCRWKQSGASRWQAQGAECRHTRGFESKSLSTLSFGLTSTWDARRSGADAALVVNCASGFWLPLLRRAGIPSVVNVDGLEWERGKWNRLARAMFRTGARLSARYGDELVADSVAIAEIWAEQFGVRPRFIPYGAPVLESDDDALVAELGLPLGGYGLTVARLVPENNVELTLDALEAMGADRPPWAMVGSAVGWGEIEDRLRALDRRPDFRWLGHVSDQRLLDQLWRHCGVLVHGHSVGGTNPSLLQAMGAGAPVVAFDTPFSREVLADGVSTPTCRRWSRRSARCSDPPRPERSWRKPVANGSRRPMRGTASATTT